jgi:hypothetical protein
MFKTHTRPEEKNICHTLDSNTLCLPNHNISCQKDYLPQTTPSTLSPMMAYNESENQKEDILLIFLTCS